MVIKATVIKALLAEMYVNVVFVIRCLYSAVSLTLVKEWRLIKIVIIIIITTTTISSSNSSSSSSSNSSSSSRSSSSSICCPKQVQSPYSYYFIYY